MKTVMIFGTFDIVHHGHLFLFRRARRYGQKLIAVIARDSRVSKIKKRKPVYNERERKHFLEQIRLIDQVLLGDSKDVYKVIQKIEPDVIALGYDQNHFVENLQKKIQEFGLQTRIVRLPSYHPQKNKSGKIRNLLEQNI